MEARIARIFQKILGESLLKKEDDDVCQRQGCSSRLYLVQSIFYRVMHARSFGNDHDGNFEDIWRIQIIPEVSIFLWRLFRNRLPSSDNLLRRNILLEGDQGRCLGCNKVVESISHVLFWCPKVNMIQKKMLWVSAG